MLHSRTGKPLDCEWVVDYFHVCNYVTKPAEAIFGDGKEAHDTRSALRSLQRRGQAK